MQGDVEKFLCRLPRHGSGPLSVVGDDAERMALTGANPAHPHDSCGASAAWMTAQPWASRPVVMRGQSSAATRSATASTDALASRGRQGPVTLEAGSDAA